MQGFNMGRYHAPSTLDTSLTTATSSSRRKPPPSSAPPTIRFEMPFAIWCTTCPSQSPSSLIGQGVRFNATKTRVGAYFTTPIWSFRMTHTACGGLIEIRTDPKNTAYVVTAGARARDTGSDVVVAERSGALLIGDEAERERARQDAFRAFEVGIEDREEAVVAKERVEELWEASREWERHDDANAKLRRVFRVGRDERKRQALRDGGLADRMSFGFELVGEVESDTRRAKMVEYGGTGSDAGVVDDLTAEERMAGRPLFLPTRADAFAAAEKKLRTTHGGIAKKSASAKPQLPAATLHTILVAATRARLDTFGATPTHSTTSPASIPRKHKDGTAIIPGLKRKRQSPPTSTQKSGIPKTVSSPSKSAPNASSHARNNEITTPGPGSAAVAAASLVDYASDASED